MTGLSLDGVRKRFGEVEALKSIDLNIANGEFVSLLGPSGCGKTTTLRCVAGFEYPSEGVIRFGDQEVTRLPPEHRDVGMVFQSYALFPHMTVMENLSFGLEMRKVPKPERNRRIDDVLGMVQLEGYAGRFPRELSGGQQQRVALARALVIEPSVLLLDEPLANLDAALRDDMRFFIRDLQQRVGITAIYVTHDQSEAIVMSDRIVVMFDGQIAQVGPPRDIHNRPATRRVAEFVGKSNFIDGHVAERHGGGTVTVMTANGPLRAQAPDSMGQGANARCLLRPESLRFGAAQDGANCFEAILERIVFLGDGSSLQLRMKDGTGITAAAPADFSAETGATIPFWFTPENTWVLA